MKSARNIMIETNVYDEARRRGLNISKVCNEALINALNDEQFKAEDDDIVSRLTPREKTFIRLSAKTGRFMAQDPYQPWKSEAMPFSFRGDQTKALETILTFKKIPFTPSLVAKILGKLKDEEHGAS